MKISELVEKLKMLDQDLEVYTVNVDWCYDEEQEAWISGDSQYFEPEIRFWDETAQGKDRIVIIDHEECVMG